MPPFMAGDFVLSVQGRELMSYFVCWNPYLSNLKV